MVLSAVLGGIRLAVDGSKCLETASCWAFLGRVCGCNIATIGQSSSLCLRIACSPTDMKSRLECSPY